MGYFGENAVQKMDHHQPGIIHQQLPLLQNPNLSHVTNPLNCAIIQNLPHDCNENQLQAFFEDEIGGIVDCRIPLDLKTGKLPQKSEKAFAVCEFTDRSLAESCARNCSGREFKERKLRVRLLESVEFGSDGWPVSASVSIGDFNAEGGGGQQLLRVTVVTESDKRRRELQQLDLNGYHPSVPVGLAVAKAASSLMAPAGAFSQPTDGKGAAMDLLSKRIGDLTPTQMFDVVRELKEMAEGDPVGTRNLLSANPQLCLAAFQCQLALGMVKVPMIEEPPVGVVAPPPPQMMQQQQQQQQQTIPPPQVVNVAPPQMAVNRGAPPPPPPPVQQQQQQQPDSQAQLLAQVMALTPQQIAALPPDQRMQVEQLRQIAAAQGMI